MRELTFEEMEEVAGGGFWLILGAVASVAMFGVGLYTIYQNHQSKQALEAALEQLRQQSGNAELPSGFNFDGKYCILYYPDGTIQQISSGAPCGCTQ